jgi:hypothetical protein
MFLENTEVFCFQICEDSLGVLPEMIICITPSAQSRNQSSKPYFTAETQSSQRSEYFLIKNSLLRALSASAVSYLLYRYK